jgi:NADH:ubiquinone oxidoreductase subunit F (NADH-binding)
MIAPRLLAGVTAAPMTYAEHCDVHGTRVIAHGTELRLQLASSGLRGRGGGAFPLSRKVDAVARRKRRPILLVNGCEGEPMSSKDRVLLNSAPHLVIDGVLSLGDVIGAKRVLLALDRFDVSSADSVQQALAERPGSADRRRVEIVQVPSGYVTGQETALVNWCNNKSAMPTSAPSRARDRGIDGRLTLVSNVETFAHVGLIARRGVRWFQQTGTAEDPGTALITLGGAVASPGVYEVEQGSSLASLLRDAGGPTAEIAGVLVGGYAGRWVGPDRLRTLRLDRASLQRAGARLGAGIVVVLPDQACPVAETARVAIWMAEQGAGQCGPCAHGLDAVADALTDVCYGRDGRRALADVARWSGQIAGRGACAHPDGAVGMVASALRVFRSDFLDHAAHGLCEGCERPAMLQTPSFAGAGRRR